MRYPRALSAVTIAIALAAAACGSGEEAEPTTGSETIEVSMTDNEFSPNSFEVEAGQQVTFRFTNDGTVDHEALVGDADEQAAHEAEMSGDDSGGGMDGMEHGSSDADAITVGPGETGELTRTFDDAGSVILGCHVPGHYDAGMKATITIA